MYPKMGSYNIAKKKKKITILRKKKEKLTN